MRTSSRASYDLTANVTPAPGRLELVRQFLNTADFENGTDEFETPRSTRRWLVAKRLLPRNRRVSEPERIRLIELREGLRALTWANNGAPLRRDALVRLNRHASTVSIGVRFDKIGNVRFVVAAADVDHTISALVAIVCESVRDGSWSRLKACREQKCGWTFYDASRNRVGTWCSMAVCGNRAKTRAYRIRHSATRQHDQSFAHRRTRVRDRRSLRVPKSRSARS
jgi:predicted RNA-binding Zn ribbon-like protein